MPHRTGQLLGDDLVDAYRAFVAEIYDRLAADGFPDVPQAATPVFRDIADRGSRVADLAVQAGVAPDAMWEVVRALEERGYIEVDDDCVRPAERGREAYEARRRALAATEERIERRVGAERFEAFREVLREIAVGGPS
jgi:hypothetical protein